MRLPTRPVAPLVGAWIETTQRAQMFNALLSHPSWVRGLKPCLKRQNRQKAKSHPSWVRGLKLVMLQDLKLVRLSHPSWVRGLKLSRYEEKLTLLGRTPRGCVD